MFGKKKPTPDSALTTLDLLQLIAISGDEAEAKNIAARERWGIGTADSWSADLAAGTISFQFADRTITGPVQVLGSYAAASESWRWGWALDGMPGHVTTASRSTLAWGERAGLRALVEPRINTVEAGSGDDYSAITVHLSELSGMYRAPTNAGFLWLGFTEFESH